MIRKIVNNTKTILLNKKNATQTNSIISKKVTIRNSTFCGGNLVYGGSTLINCKVAEPHT